MHSLQLILSNSLFVTAPLHLGYVLLLSPIGRALLVAALLISAYALVYYWRSLNERSNRIRFSLVGLRTITLALMTCALAGVQVEYETTMRARLLLSSVRSNSARAEGAAIETDDRSKVTNQVIEAMKRKGVEVTAEGVADEVEGINSGEDFIAAALLTDGAMSAGDARREIERMSERARGVPVYVVADLGQSEGTGIALEGVWVLGRAVRGVPVAVRCWIHARGMHGRESLVTISDDAKVQASARVAWASDDERQAVTLSVLPKVAGWVDYAAKVEAAGGAEDATRLVRPFSLRVEDRRSRVLFFEGEPTWESKFIRRALEQSGLFEVDYFAQVSRAAAVGTSPARAAEQTQQEAGSEDAAGKNVKEGSAPEAKLHAALQSAAQLNAYDSVIVGATPNDLLSSAERARLSEWVLRRGGGLVVLGGNSFNGSVASPGGKLYALLPTEISAQSLSTPAQEISQGRPLEAEKTRSTLFLTPTEEGTGALSGYLNANEEAGAKSATLTGQGLRLGALRPGATTLAVAGPPGTNGTSEEGAPLIAGMRYGMGRTLVFAPADSWRIRTSASGEEDRTSGPFGALWQGIVLWTSAFARAPVEIVLSDESPAEGSEVWAEIRVRDASFAPLKIEKLNARLQPLAENTGDASQVSAQSQEVLFAPDMTDASVWRARLHLNARGRFALEVDYVASGKTGSVEKQLAVVARTPVEAGAALDTLRRAARETGGDLVTTAEIESIAERLAATSPSRERAQRTWELRSWWPLAFITPLLLSTEWFLRRWWRVD
ncbi:MAG: hypothetical protein QOH63_4045 [Acidobacteriota bacterium]|jgi:hypothetical protein|nr:hypothetical protein [Acidobacteriota bacterium]